MDASKGSKDDAPRAGGIEEIEQKRLDPDDRIFACMPMAFAGDSTPRRPRTEPRTPNAPERPSGRFSDRATGKTGRIPGLPRGDALSTFPIRRPCPTKSPDTKRPEVGYTSQDVDKVHDWQVTHGGQGQLDMQVSAIKTDKYINWLKRREAWVEETKLDKRWFPEEEPMCKWVNPDGLPVKQDRP